jgi:flagellar motor protein MotB
MILRALVVIAFVTAWSNALADVRELPLSGGVERHLSEDEPRALWVHDPDLINEDHSDLLASTQVESTDANIVKLKGLVPPVLFPSGVALIPPSTVRELRTVLEGLAERRNVRLHLVGHADNQPLSPNLVAVYQDNDGLSRERAGEVAELFQQALSLAPESMSYAWRGDTQPIASNATLAGRRENRRVEVEVWYDRAEAGTAKVELVIPSSTRRVKVCRMDDVCKLSYQDGHDHRARVQNLIAPLHYDTAGIEVSPGFVERVRRTFSNLADRQNVVVRFVGYTDSQPLGSRAEKIYGDHEGLSKALAWRVALDVQEALGLPTAAIDATGRGTALPLASDKTPAGQGKNRRVEVEFWYDDQLQDLAGEPQLCPAAAGEEEITRVYRPTWGELPRLEIGQGDVALPQELAAKVARAMTDVADRAKVRLRFVGFVGNQALNRRTARIYGDDIGLSAARARRAMEAVGEQLGLAPEQLEYEGRGFLHSDDVVNAGFTQVQDSYVKVEVVYDAYVASDDLDGVDIMPLRRELHAENAFALNMMRITVNGDPVDDPGRSSADLQRCTDVALEDADVQFAFNNLSVERRLSVDAYPLSPAVASDGGALVDPVTFRMHANYLAFIERAEVRIFESGDSARTEPLLVLPVAEDGTAFWREAESVSLKPRTLGFVLRTYGEDGAFDETRLQALELISAAAVPEPVDLLAAMPKRKLLLPETDKLELLSAYGDDQLALTNIRLSSGTVRVHGTAIPEGRDVWVAGYKVPVDAAGNFTTEQILPEGAHTVEVAVLDQQGSGELFLRDLEFESNDWFYVGMADMTFATADTTGASELIDSNDDLDDGLSGRLAFYANGKFGDKWHLTTSVDTREGEVGDWFKDFVDKSPDALLRRVDPDYHYPTFGDDSTVIEHAPTSGNVYLKVGRRETHGLWGNYNVHYDQNELARVDRGLYGVNLHHESAAATSFGERRFGFDGFAAEPGTLATRQEFRGTGGSLYFLKHQDLLMGGERLQVELRDAASGLVTGVVHLRPSLDYEIDYLQGTVLLAEPLMSTVQDEQLVRSGAISGDAAFLVVRYEYTPGFDEIDAVTTGTQAHYWINDHIKVGATMNFNELDGTDSNLQGSQLVLRKSAASWLKVQSGQIEGQLQDTLRSSDGGFEFANPTPLPTLDKADAYRVDVSVGLEDFFPETEGRATFYQQQLDAGYNAPGMISVGETENSGGTIVLPVGEDVEFNVKSDLLKQVDGLHSERHEVGVQIDLNDRWQVATGVRHDLLDDERAVPLLTQAIGARTDAVLKLGYQSEQRWSMYGYAQETVSKDDNLENNGRIGIGGGYNWSDEVTVEGELSTGDNGDGGRVGTRFKASERTSLYLNYALEQERTDNVARSIGGQQGNLVAGAKTRLSDTTSVFAEEHYRHSAQFSGQTHATGVNYRPSQAWNLGLSSDIGALRDLETGTETDRNALGMRASYKLGDVNFSAAVEYRQDESERAGLATEDRETWLYRTNFKWQLSDSNRLLGKVGHATSESSLGQFFDGGFTEVSVGYGLRPIAHDRFDALVKYTYFYNVPTADQVTVRGTAAEFVQKSHVTSVDVNYRLTSRWSVGGKYAHRLGEISLDRDEREFFDNRAHLYVLRSDVKLWDNWEVMVEGRQLQMIDFEETRSGALVTISRYVGDNLKVGLGYSFTDFSDDLTDLDFNHRGAFLNITGVL